MKTAMMELIEALKTTYEECLPEFKEGIAHCILEASCFIEKEKQQLEEAWKDGVNEGGTQVGNFEWGIRRKDETFEQYYSNTFDQK